MKMINNEDRTLNLDTLSRKANKYYNKSNYHWRGALEYARKCGQMLIQTRRLVKNRKWKKWVEANFDASYETAKIYVRVARHWDDERLIKAREKGIEINSINSFLNILKNQPDSDSSPVYYDSNNPNHEKSMVRQEIRERFAVKLRDLEAEQLKLFLSHFDKIWEVAYISFKKIAHKKLGYDPDIKLLESVDKAKRRKAKSRNRRYNNQEIERDVKMLLKEQEVRDRLQLEKRISKKRKHKKRRRAS